MKKHSLYNFYNLLGVIVFVFYTAKPQTLFAQLIQNKKIEFIVPSKDIEPEFHINPLKQEGFLLQERNENVFANKNNIWFTSKYNIDMHMLWHTESVIDSESEFITDFLSTHKYYQLFGTTNETKIKILQFDLQTGDSEWIDGNIVGIQNIEKMKVIGSMVYFSGQYQGKAVVVGLSLFDKTIKTLKGFYSIHTELVEIDADTTNNHLHIYTKNRYKNQCKLLLNTYNKDGALLSVSELESQPKKLPFNGKKYNLDAQNSLVIGNYARYCDNFSQGMYVKRMDEMHVTASNFIDYSELKNFFNYLNPKRQERINKRIAKKKSEGKSLNFNYRMLVHQIEKYNDELIVLSEVFYTEPRSQGVYFNSKGYSNLNYRFTHAVICAFDQNGNLLWDNCLPMKNLSNTFLNEQVQLSKIHEQYVLAYPEDGKIKTQLVEKNTLIREKENFSIVNENEGRWISEADNGFTAWYDQSFLVWGYKKMANNADSKMFIINKLTYTLSAIEPIVK